MTSKAKKETSSPVWKDGESGNPKGRPRGTGRSVSRLRRTITKLEEYVDAAVDNVGRSVNGEDVEKSTLDSSKWVITTIPALSRAATAEEQLRENVRARQEENELRLAEAEAEIARSTHNVIDGRKRFSTAYVDEDF